VMPANMWHQHIIHKPHQFSSCLAAVPIAPKVRKWVSYSIVKLNYRITNPLSDTANTVKYCDEYVGLSVHTHILTSTVYLLTPLNARMYRATLLHVKSTILHCPPSIITRQRVAVDSRPRNVGYCHIFER